MKGNVHTFLLCLILVISTIFSCYGEESPASLIVISGNSSVITPDMNDTYRITVNDVEPYAILTCTNQTDTSVSLNEIKPAENSNTAIVTITAEGNNSVFMIQASDFIYAEDSNKFSFSGYSMRYYDGIALSQYSGNQSTLEPGDYGTTHVYIEYAVQALNNC